GGQLDEPFRWFLADPFERRTGARVTLVPSLSLEVIAKIKASLASPPFDVIVLDEGPHLQAVTDGIVQRIDERMVPNLAQVYPAYRRMTHGFGVPQAYSVVGLAYDTRKVRTPPTSWRDLFKPEFKGQVGVVNLNSSLGVAFLVMLARLNGGGEANIEPGFTAFRDLMGSVSAVAPRPGALAALFEREEVAIAPLWNNTILTLREKGLPVDWVVPKEGAMVVMSVMNMVINTRHPQLAVQFINDAISKEYQVKAAVPPYFFGPTNSGVNLPAALRRYLPTRPEEVARLLTLDWTAINRNRQAWTDRFNREFAR
ncbi:MAG TPA: extracellular solute-binding protein, partial [bacterium]|nr:extracellular solute-binding protein [bacterium]